MVKKRQTKMKKRGGGWFSSSHNKKRDTIVAKTNLAVAKTRRNKYIDKLKKGKQHNDEILKLFPKNKNALAMKEDFKKTITKLEGLKEKSITKKFLSKDVKGKIESLSLKQKEHYKQGNKYNNYVGISDDDLVKSLHAQIFHSRY